MPAYAYDWINGQFMCLCSDSDNQVVNLATGEFQCVVDCGDCSKTWSPEDGQFNPLCPAV